MIPYADNVAAQVFVFLKAISGGRILPAAGSDWQMQRANMAVVSAAANAAQNQNQNNQTKRPQSPNQAIDEIRLQAPQSL
jgi:hypothetical protein